MPRPSFAPRRFTLLEMLVVIVIITILLSLLFAGFSRVRKAGTDTICVSQLKQFHTSSVLFLNANRQRYPGDVLNTTDLQKGRCWIGQLGSGSDWSSLKVTDRPMNAYLGATSNGASVPVAKCPLNEEDLDAFIKVGSSYAGNSNDSWLSLKSLRLTSVKNPSRTILGMEIGTMAFATGTSYKSYWRMTHGRKASPTYPIVRVDGSGFIHTFQNGEGRNVASAKANFDINL
jgi:prepilin-type N-terminal cleavage/methylation domain-containing protein